MNKIRLGIINTNYVKIGQYTKKGTEIFDYILITNLAKLKKKSFNITAFCSGNSRLPVKIESVSYWPSIDSKQINSNSHPLFEAALVSKAISLQKNFDLYHVNLGNGEYVLPFAEYTKKPILVTMHGTSFEPYTQKYYSLYKNLKNVFFVSISNYQRKPLPFLNYIKTIHHGINTKLFAFNPLGGKHMVWTGRAIPEKGLDTIITVAKKTKKTTKVFPIIKDEYLEWLHNEIIKKRDIISQIVKISIDFNVNRNNLVCEYQNSKLFLFPLRWEEPFGLTLIESMSCGTPVVAFARGSVPEIIKDGETGFIVNPSDDDIRGNWMIKKTGIEGLCEAIERIYRMPEAEYKAMRLACRQHAEANFTVERMIDQYEEVYKQILNKR